MKSIIQRGNVAGSILGSRLLESFPQTQSLSFSTRSFSGTSRKPELNILFFCPRNEDHFRSFDTEYPDFIHSIHPKSVSISDIAHRPQNNSAAVTSLLNHNVTPSSIIPHLVLIGHTKDEADEKIRFFHESGIKSILVIRGNPMTVKQDMSYTHHPDGYEDMPHLMRRIKDLSPEMKIIVAGYPEKHPFDVNAERGLDELKRKVDAGADMIVTQHFFDNRHFLEFLNGCQKRGINLPVMPSILPIGNPKYLFSFSKAAGIDIPAEVGQILFGQDGLTTNSEDITNPEIRKRASDYTARHIKSLVELDLPQVDRINTYAANNIRFLSEVLEKVGVTKSLTDDKDKTR
jgi:methylenetetrahydrofolate reductase (NADPH)